MLSFEGTSQLYNDVFSFRGQGPCLYSLLLLCLFGSAGDVVLNFPPYLIKMHIGLSGPKSDLGPINPAALLCGVILLLISLDFVLEIWQIIYAFRSTRQDLCNGVLHYMIGTCNRAGALAPGPFSLPFVPVASGLF